VAVREDVNVDEIRRRQLLKLLTNAGRAKVSVLEVDDLGIASAGAGRLDRRYTDGFGGEVGHVADELTGGVVSRARGDRPVAGIPAAIPRRHADAADDVDRAHAGTDMHDVIVALQAEPDRDVEARIEGQAVAIAAILDQHEERFLGERGAALELE